MKKLIVILILWIIAALPALSQEMSDSRKQEIVNIYDNFLDLLDSGKYPEAQEMLDSTMQDHLDSTRLKNMWMGINTQFGKITEQVSKEFETYSDPNTGKNYDIILVENNYETGSLITRMVVDRNDKIAGLFLQPPKADDIKLDIPEYADTSLFYEKEVTVGRGSEWKLPGTLSIPKDGEKFPAVVLVHGSGPNDRNEAIGPNRPFRDLAWGLASNGIAVLRYEKRTKEYQETISGKEITLYEETVQDAARAVDLLAGHEKIDKNKIYVLGHSLGGYAIPKIAKETAIPAGYISLAGSAQPLQDMILEQHKYIFNLDNEMTEDEIKEIEKIEKQVKMVESEELSADTPKDKLPMGVSGKYWLYLRDYYPTKEAKNIDKPMFFLQGERDYQVTVEEDLKMWKEALSGRDDVKFKVYKKLNHLFMYGHGPSKPAEYMSKGHVYKEVIGDIAEWINTQDK